MAITHVQSGGVNADSTTSVSRAFASNVTSGNLVVVLVDRYSPSADPFTAADCTKSAGTATIGSVSMHGEIEIAYDGGSDTVAAAIFSAIVTGTGSLTMQVAGSPGGSYFNFATGEFSSDVGWDASREESLNESSSTGTGTSAASGNITTAGHGLMLGVLGVAKLGNDAITEDAAFTSIFEEPDGANHMVGSLIRRIVTSGTTDDIGWTWTGGTDGHVCIAAALREVGGAPADTLMGQVWT